MPFAIVTKKMFPFFKTYTSFSKTKLKFYSKKKNSIKNKFTFQHEYQKQFAPETISEGRIISSELLLERKFDSESSLNTISYSKSRKNRRKNFSPTLTYRGEIVFGIHPVYLALSQKKRALYHLFVRMETDAKNQKESQCKQEIIALAKSLNIPVSFVDSKGLRILAPGAVHQGVCLDAGFLPFTVWNEDKAGSKKSESRKLPLWLVLDEILDPMNVGAIIRSAYYFGINKVFTVLGNSCKLSPTVSKASSGALEVIDLYQLENLEAFIKDRRNNQWSIVSTLAYAENKVEADKVPIISATDFKISKPTILILGNEGRGISVSIQKLCDTFISIKPSQVLHHGIDSLNVSVATGILLYALNSKNLQG